MADIDHGYAWVVLTASFGLQIIFGAFALNSGIITGAILEFVDSDLTKASWVGSALFATPFLMGPVAGLYHRRVGAKVAAFTAGFICLVGMISGSFVKSVIGLLCTFSFITGCGLSIGLNIVGAVPGLYFHKRRSVATAVLWTGSGCGMFLGSVLIGMLLDEYNLSGTLLILGAVSLHICVAGVVFENINPHVSHEKNITMEKGRATPEPNISVVTVESQTEVETDIRYQTGSEPNADATATTGNNDAKEESIDSPKRGTFVTTVSRCISVMRRNGFFMYNFSTLFWFIAESALTLHLPNYAISKGSTPWQARSLISIFGITTIISKLLIGLASTDSSISIYLLYSGNMGLAGVITLLFPFMSDKYYLQCIYATFFGLQLGGPSTLFCSITIDLTGVHDLELGFGIMTFFCGIGQLSGPPAAGWIYEVSQNYDFTFVMAGISLMLSCVCAAVIPTLKNSSDKRDMT